MEDNENNFQNANDRKDPPHKAVKGHLLCFVLSDRNKTFNAGVKAPDGWLYSSDDLRTP